MTDDLLQRLQAALSGRYEVERLLGEGGMAIVFLARDVKHDRQVALKILKPELAASLGAERFLREIRVTAKLSHPHILPLYDSGEADGLLYYVMPYVTGESLASYVAREKQLALAEAMRITREVASALGHAHSLGLVHRDIKPENVLLSGGHAIVADFGISRAVAEAGGDKLTQTGMAIGTPAYMSPEQIGGDPDVDARSDLYSLGCMLYEMLVGQVPFTGPTAMAVMARHTMDHVTPPSIMRQSIPPELEDVVLKAMEKVPADRFRTAQELVQVLDAVERGDASPLRRSVHAGAARLTGRSSRIGAATPRRRRGVIIGGVTAGAALVAAALWALFRGPDRSASPAAGLDTREVAVLYFDDLSPDSSLGYLADALTEGLIGQLSQVRELHVISRNGVAPYRGSNTPPDSIGRALQVGTIIAGSVQPAGDQIRVSTQLVDGGSGSAIDRVSFQLPAGNALAVRDSLVGVVARSFRERLGDEVGARDRRAQTTDLDAWTLRQRAERRRKDAAAALAHEDYAHGLSEWAAADSLLAAAAGEDRQWAEPVVLRGQIAYARSRLEVQDGPATALPWIDRAMGFANEALARDPNHPEAFELRGTAQYFRWLLDVDDRRAADALLAGARADLDSALSLDGTLAGAHNTKSHLLFRIGERTDGILEARRAYEEDAYLAVAPDVLHRLYQGLYDAADLAEAGRWCNEGGRRFPQDPRFAECRLMLRSAPGATPDVTLAWSLADRMAAPPPAERSYRRHLAEILVGAVLARAGLTDSATAVLGRARGDARVDPQAELAFYEAYARTLTNQPEEAIAQLKRYLLANPDQDHGITEGDLFWWWADLQRHPRFADLTVGRR